MLRSPKLLGAAGVLAVAAVVVAVIILSRPAENTPTAAPTAAPPTSEPLPQPEPFEVTLAGVQGRGMDSGNLYNRRSPKRPRVVDNAAREAAGALQRYLNAAFVAPETRFQQEALHGFMTIPAQRQMPDRLREALGVGGADIAGGVTRNANARATVLYRGNRALVVTLRYRARMDVLADGRRREPLRQEGTIVFARAGRGWRADMLDVRLTRPDALPGDVSGESS